MTSTWVAPGGWAVTAVTFASPGDWWDGQWLLICKDGQHQGMVRSIAALTEFVNLKDLEEVTP